ncbi:MAG: hypothetical protein KAI47_10375, partial [Deltaproteobacteria bacterium]|nr:hypothetical protein [Deltaproteobacteria bacterium]
TSWVLLIALPACKRAPSTPKVSLPPLRSTAKTLPAPLGRLPKGTALVPISSGISDHPALGDHPGLLRNSASKDKPPRVAASPPAGPLPPLDAMTARLVRHQLRLSQRFLLQQPARNAVVSGWLAHAMTAAMQGAARHARPFAEAVGFARPKATLGTLERLRRRVLADAERARRGTARLRLNLSLGVFTAGATGPVSRTYLSRLHTVNTTIRHLLQSPQSLGVIDRWIAAQTAGTISDAFSHEHQKMPELVVIATGYLRAPWQLPFRTRDTAPGPFFTARCRAHTTLLMQKTMRLPSAETKLAYIVEVPFIGKAFALRLVIPKAVDGLLKHRQALTALLHRAHQEPLEGHSIHLVLPRLRLSANANLLDTAIAVIPQLGTLRAYPHFGTTRLRKLTQLGQYGFLRVEEWGAEAALAMIATIGYGGRPTITEVRADHPFLLSIIHVASHTSLFAAQIFDLGETTATAPPSSAAAITRRTVIAKPIVCYRPPRVISSGRGLSTGRGHGLSSGVRLTFQPKKHSELLRRIVRRHVNEIIYCVRISPSELTPKSTPCRLTLHVGQDGRATVKGLRPTGQTPRKTCSCIETAVRRWTFPKPKEPSLTKPYTLTIHAKPAGT